MKTEQQNKTSEVASGLFRQASHNLDNPIVIPHENGITTKTGEGNAPRDVSQFVESDCVFTMEGKSFEADGAIITKDFVVAYPKENGILGDWHGNPIGTWKAISTWKTPRSYFSSTMSQIEATIAGKTFTGRGAGEGCIFKGKAKKA